MKPLSEPEQALWRRLSVFAGSFSREAIEAVCLEEDIPQETAAICFHLIREHEY